jgi:uncharacterized repeat protein (TIGR01451 family)
MTTSQKNRSSGLIRGALTLLTLAFLWVAALPAESLASTAANTVIRNTVSVNYRDTASNPMPQVQATVDISVALVYATPTLTQPADQSTVPGTPAVYTYTITSNANGPDTYALTTNIDSQVPGISGSTAVAAPVSVTLGGTTIATAVTIAAAGTTAITVPNDAAANSSVNGITSAAGTTVVINGVAYTVASIVDNGGTVGGTSTITVNGNGTASGVLPVGTIIGQRATFTMTVTPGTITTAANQTITVTTSAKGGGAPLAATDVTVTTVNVATLGVTKEVSADGNTWYSGVVPPATLAIAPGATLYYRITVTNSGSSNATSVVITDPQPLYTTYLAGSGRRVLTGTPTNYGAAGAALTDASAADDGYDFGVTTAGQVTFSIASISPLSAAPANAVQLFFRVTVNN